MNTIISQSVLLRAVVAGLTAFAISAVLGKICIELQLKQNIGQAIRIDGPESHQIKAGTPTAGGVSFIAAISIAVLIWLKEPAIRNTSLLALIGFGLIGLWDDALKILRSTNDGLSAGYKIALQVVMSYILLFVIDRYFSLPLSLSIPWKEAGAVKLGNWYYIFAIVYIVFITNSCNLSDGLDGMASGLGIISLTAVVIIGFLTAYGVGHQIVVLYIMDEQNDLLVFSMAMIGGLLGFLWYNARPAQIFMGDTGSMGIGGVLAYIGIITHNEIVMLIIGGVFVIEALSVIIQVSSYKLTHRRVFKMAPIHHHFEKIGWGEEKIVQRFWIISILFALLGILAAMRV